MYFEFEEQLHNPVQAKLRYAIMGGVALLLLLALSVRSLVPSIEKDLTERVSASLIENNLDNILLTVSGRDITLEGLVTQNNYNKILDLTREVSGVRTVNDKLTLIDKQPVKKQKQVSGDRS